MAAGFGRGGIRRIDGSGTLCFLIWITNVMIVITTTVTNMIMIAAVVRGVVDVIMRGGVGGEGGVKV